jgi:hypothetical protein
MKKLSVKRLPKMGGTVLPEASSWCNSFVILAAPVYLQYQLNPFCMRRNNLENNRRLLFFPSALGNKVCY